MPTVAAALRNNPRVKYEIEKITRIIVVVTLVENSGFCFPRIVGIKEIIKIQLPAKKTKSCQCCIEKRISLSGLVIQQEFSIRYCADFYSERILSEEERTIP